MTFPRVWTRNWPRWVRPAVLLVVQKHAHVVLAGRDNQRARIDVRFQERGQHGRGAEAFAHVALIPALAHYDLIHARLKTREIRPGRTGIALRLAVDRELPGARVGHHARLLSEAGHQHRDHVPRVYGAGHGRQPRIRDLKRERGVPVLPGDFHGVRARSHLVEHQLAFLQIDRRPIVHHHLALVQIGQQANRLRLRLKRQADRRRLPGRHGDGARRGLEAVQRRGDLVSARRQRQLAVGCAGSLVAAAGRGLFRGHPHGRARRSGRNVDLDGRLARRAFALRLRCTTKKMSTRTTSRPAIGPITPARFQLSEGAAAPEGDRRRRVAGADSRASRRMRAEAVPAERSRIKGMKRQRRAAGTRAVRVGRPARAPRHPGKKLAAEAVVPPASQAEAEREIAVGRIPVA